MQRQIIPDGARGTAATLAAMAKFAVAGSKTEAVRNLAVQIVSTVPARDYLSEASAIHEWVRDHIRFVRDPVSAELVQTPRYTLARRSGDCDDQATLIAALLESIGIPARFQAAGQTADEMQHVWTEAEINGTWVPLDTAAPQRLQAGQYAQQTYSLPTRMITAVGNLGALGLTLDYTSSGPTLAQQTQPDGINPQIHATQGELESFFSLVTDPVVRAYLVNYALTMPLQFWAGAGNGGKFSTYAIENAQGLAGRIGGTAGFGTNGFWAQMTTTPALPSGVNGRTNLQALIVADEIKATGAWGASNGPAEQWYRMMNPGTQTGLDAALGIAAAGAAIYGGLVAAGATAAGTSSGATIGAGTIGGGVTAGGLQATSITLPGVTLAANAPVAISPVISGFATAALPSVPPIVTDAGTLPGIGAGASLPPVAAGSGLAQAAPAGLLDKAAGAAQDVSKGLDVLAPFVTPSPAPPVGTAPPASASAAPIASGNKGLILLALAAAGVVLFEVIS